MKKIYLFILFLSSFFICNFQNSSKDSIKLSLIKKQNGNYNLNIDIKQGFGIQISAPNRILLGPSSDLKIIKADLKITGIIHENNLEYYKKINPIPITLNGSGKINVNAKLYFCNLKKKICIPGKFNLTEEIK